MVTSLRSYDLLYDCNDVSEVDSILDDLEIPTGDKNRKIFLNQFMGITQSLACGQLTIEEEYTIAKEELVFMNAQRKNVNKPSLLSRTKDS